MAESDGTRVLVVDDDAAALEATSAMLTVSGFEVRCAQNGAVGLEEVITFRPEVVVFDFWMPVADGRDLLQGIREVEKERIGLVAVSGTPEVEDWCARVGVHRFVRKPFDRPTLAEAVGLALDDARMGSVRTRSVSSMPVSRRLRVDRAVLLVGEREHVRPVRTLLRDGTRPFTVAAVMGVADAVRALEGFQVDAVAVLGRDAAGDPSLVDLVRDAMLRGLPIVLDRAHEVELPHAPGLVVCPDDAATSVVEAIHRVVSGARVVGE